MEVDLQALVDTARRRGCRGCELLYVESTGLDLVAKAARVVHREEVSSHRLVLRCWLEGGRVGKAAGSPEDFDALLDEALEAAQDAPEDPLDGPAPKLPIKVRTLGIDDRRYSMLEERDRRDVVVEAERGASLEDRRVHTGLFRYSDRRIHRSVASSRGLEAEEWSTVHRADGELWVDVPGGRLHMRDFIESRAFASVASLPFGVLLAQRAMELSRGGPRISGPVRVGLHARATAALFAALAPAFTWSALSGGEVFLSEGLDKPGFLDEKLHLLDDGTVNGGMRSRLFDDRGVPPVPLTLVREGKVGHGFVSPRQARELGQPPTGHQWPHGLGPSNLLLRGGTRSMHALMSELDSTVFLVDHLEDLEGLDLVTGKARLVASGFLFQGTVKVGAARRVVLEADLRKALTQVVAVSSDTDRVGHVDAPGMIVDGFTATEIIDP